MGCAALRIQDWDIAIKAFNRVVSMDRDNGEAWTNLASVFIKQKKKREAWRAIREALRSKYDASNILENYSYVSIDVHEYISGRCSILSAISLIPRVTHRFAQDVKHFHIDRNKHLPRIEHGKGQIV